MRADKLNFIPFHGEKSFYGIVRTQETKAGDLYFFAEIGVKITHVGIAPGKGRTIHVRGKGQENSLNPQNTDFDRELYNSFVDVRTFL
jgi:cell wall-associated NlpC family hydrolase